MAIFYTLAIDCDQDDAVASRIADHFDQFQFSVNADGDETVISCAAEAWRSRRCWGQQAPQLQDWMMVTITQPVYHGGPRQELVNAETLMEIRNALYARLKEQSGYRTAIFGEERQDILGMYDWLESLENFLSADDPLRYFEGLIVEKSLAVNRPIRKHLVEFRQGYLWWNAPMNLRFNKNQ